MVDLPKIVARSATSDGPIRCMNDVRASYGLLFHHEIQLASTLLSATVPLLPIDSYSGGGVPNLNP